MDISVNGLTYLVAAALVFFTSRSAINEIFRSGLIGLHNAYITRLNKTNLKHRQLVRGHWLGLILKKYYTI